MNLCVIPVLHKFSQVQWDLPFPCSAPDISLKKEGLVPGGGGRMGTNRSGAEGRDREVHVVNLGSWRFIHGVNLHFVPTRPPQTLCHFRKISCYILSSFTK